MKIKISATLSLTAVALLAACATKPPPQNNIQHDRKQIVIYDCGVGKKKQLVRTMYALNGDAIAAVQVMVGEQKTPVLLPQENTGVFANSGVAWNMTSASVAKLAQTKIQSLTVTETQTVKGKEKTVTKAIVQNCRVNPKATQEANREP